MSVYNKLIFLFVFIYLYFTINLAVSQYGTRLLLNYESNQHFGYYYMRHIFSLTLNPSKY